MLGDLTQIEKYYIICGFTDMRAGINRLADLVTYNYKLNPYESAAFFFCGRQKYKLRVLLWEKDGFVMITKRFENGSMKWPKNSDEAKMITRRQLEWLLEGLELEPKKSIKEFDTKTISQEIEKYRNNMTE